MATNCTIKTPTTSEPTEAIKQVYRCLKAMNYDPEGRLNCTSTDIKRPPECPKEPGSDRDDPTGYATCVDNEVEKRTSSANIEELEAMETLVAGGGGLGSEELSYVDTLVDPYSPMTQSAKRPGAAWVECGNLNPAELLMNALHEVCHLKEQCDRKKPINERQAALCAGDRFFRVAQKYDECRILISNQMNQGLTNSTE